MPVSQRKRSFQLFRKMKFLSSATNSNSNNSNTSTNSNAFGCHNDENTQVDIDKMILHVLDCLGALQCVLGQYDASKAKVFWGALATIADIGMEQAMGHVDRRHPGAGQLLRAFPNELKASDGRGWLPLHWAAVQESVGVEEVRQIAKSDPCATMKGCNHTISATPGHLIAAVRHPHMEVVRALYNFHPRMAHAKDQEGDLPLHYAARYSESTEMILFLLQANPGATKVRGEGTLVPLQNALYHENPVKKTEIVQLLLDADPTAASIVHVDGNTVLHIAMEEACPANLLASLLHAFPDGVRMRNDIGYLPLHAACLSTDVPRSLETVDLLLQQYPEAVRVACAYGHLPAHVAAESSTPTVLARLLDVYPEASMHQAREDLGYTPLMKAVSAGNENTVAFLVERYPACLPLQHTHGGGTALHLAAEQVVDDDNEYEYDNNNCDRDDDRLQYRYHSILKKLLNANPECAKIPDWEGRRPFHVFVYAHGHLHNESKHARSRELETFRALLRAYPEAMTQPDKHQETPLSFLLQRKNAFLTRMMLRCHCPVEYQPLLRSLNYPPRRQALFLMEAAVHAEGVLNIFARLRGTDQHILREVFSYL